jgi:hypothetical protein
MPTAGVRASLALRVDPFRALRAEIETSVRPVATSVDGRRLMRLDSAADSASIAEPWFAPPG